MTALKFKKEKCKIDKTKIGEIEDKIKIINGEISSLKEEKEHLLKDIFFIKYPHLKNKEGKIFKYGDLKGVLIIEQDIVGPIAKLKLFKKDGSLGNTVRIIYEPANAVEVSK